MPSQQPNNSSQIRSFQIKASVRTMWMCIAFLGLAMMSVGLATGKSVPAGTITLTAGVVMAIWTRRASIVRLFDDHFEMKLAPLAPVRRVRYGDIESVEVLSKKAGRVTLRDDPKNKPIKIPLSMLANKEGKSLMDFLSAKAAA